MARACPTSSLLLKSPPRWRGRPDCSGGGARDLGARDRAHAAALLDSTARGEGCTCGAIIRAVRAASGRGVKAREVDTRNKDEKTKVAQQYKIMVSPAVLFLDGSGKEVNRFEGESKETLESVKAALDKMAKK